MIILLDSDNDCKKLIKTASHLNLIKDNGLRYGETKKPAHPQHNIYALTVCGDLQATIDCLKKYL